MTTDNSLPDVWVLWESGALVDVFYIDGGRPEKLRDDEAIDRYTPAAPAEATINSLRDALREFLDGEGDWTHERVAAARALLAKDAP